jgi:hypothetical protein
MIQNGTKKLERTQAKILTALLSSGTLEIAARKSGTSPSTVKRMLRDEAFAAKFRAAKRKMLSIAIEKLSSIAADAADALHQAILSKRTPPAIKVMAARACFEILLRARGANLLTDEHQTEHAALAQGAKQKLLNKLAGKQHTKDTIQ